MAVLDDLLGFEFEDVMEDVFRNLGYQNYPFRGKHVIKKQLHRANSAATQLKQQLSM
ncbi:hypothetical protein SAMN04488556_4193 [Halostagnicola kamekurae]|uniref:Uncharacterized protein n=1 Tax=Halostagnicola kamekurae TaxID=619731 RepID=A0A1I6UZ51_9EURY|nr:hypothetical protein SAMN04488556_4193 [Halostagnicola kamekurae]